MKNCDNLSLFCHFELMYVLLILCVTEKVSALLEMCSDRDKLEKGHAGDYCGKSSR